MPRLYHANLMACSKKSRIVLNEKGPDYDSQYVNLRNFEHHNPEYLKPNPNGLVPTSVHDGAAIIEFSLDEILL
jgi:glutathione S-transferase